MERLYLAGPMSGIPQFNYPRFNAVAAALREQGFSVVNPAELDDFDYSQQALASEQGALGDVDVSWGTVLGRDVTVVADTCDGVMLLEGWERSRGAVLEVTTALLVDLPVYEVVEWPDGEFELFPLTRDYLADTVANKLRDV